MIFYGEYEEKMNETDNKITTDRLDLIAATLEHLDAELESPNHLASLLNTVVEDGWPPGEYNRDAQEFFRDRLMEGGNAVVGWYGWYALLKGSMSQPSVLVGAGGFLGPPDDNGKVEIGFSIMPAWQGRGYATEMVDALIRKAFADVRVQKIIAHTTLLNTASSNVLEKCGLNSVCINNETGIISFEILRTALL